MLWLVRVESNFHESLCVQDQNNRSYGKAIVNFHSPAHLFCEGHFTHDEKAWFERLDTLLNGELCNVINPFLNAVYAGDWDYEEDEYDFFKRRNPDIAAEIGIEAFQRTVKEIKGKWTDIQLVISGVETLIRGMKALTDYPTWFDPDYSTAEFEALLYTLSLLAKRGAEKVRIIIE